MADLFELLPAVYRIEDAQRKRALEAFLATIASQAKVVEHDIEDLWDDFFIETCAAWVIPYIGDLVANNSLHEIGQRGRADVFKTIHYRRRKGTLSMLEAMARDVTRWGAHAVPFLESLEWSQNLNHLRMVPAPNPERLAPNVTERNATANIRDVDKMDLVHGPFDVTSHFVDVRRIGQSAGWYNIGNVGIFLWRLRDYGMRGVSAHLADGAPSGRYHFSPLGNPMTLFNPEREVSERDVAVEETVPAAIRPASMYHRGEHYYGHDRPIGVYVGGMDRGDLVPDTDVVCKDLRSWSPPAEGKVAIDVRLGRVMFETPPDGDVFVSYSYGFGANIGGGPYDRRVTPAGAVQSLGTVARPASLDRLIRVPNDFPTLAAALAAWDPADDPRTVIQIDDSRTYDAALNVNVGRGRLVIQAQNGQRPCLEGRIDVRGDADAGRFELDGLLVSGHVRAGDSLNHLRIAHCTFVPGVVLGESDGRPLRPDQPSVVVDAGNDRVFVEIEASVLGPVEVPAEARVLEIRDSIVDSPLRSAPAVYRPALVSGRLGAFSGLSSPAPAIEVSAGEVGPFTISIGGAPTTIGELGDALESALRGAHRNRVFRRARVVGVPGSKRLIVLSGGSTPISVAPAGDDPTAGEMRLDETSAYAAPALIGARLESVALSAATVEVGVGTTVRKPTDTTFESVPTSVAQARGALQRAIRSAAGGQTLARALVARANNRLIVIPGAANNAITLGTTEADRTTLFELGLHVLRPALAAGTAGIEFGPATRLERTTVFGRVHARTLDASEAIFVETVIAERRQRGCVRFSFVPEGSRVPRRYRCQPDLALQGVTEERERRTVIERLQPSFTSIHYGDPAYAQLSLNCASENRVGAEDGSEMGVFQHLRQPQREANLRIRLEEYLPFGLKAGIIYVT